MMNALSKKINSFLLVLLLCSLAAHSQKDNRIFDESDIKISGVSINSLHSDFGSSLIGDSLYFTTFNDKLSRSSDRKLKEKEFYDLYKAKIDGQGNTVGERKPVEAFITRFNDGPVSWCPKTGELFVTQNYQDQSAKTRINQKDIVRLKIVIAQTVNGEWKTLTDFPYNNRRYSVGHPAINETGDTLVFSSDIPGGFGETDLYYSVRKNGKWELPVNMGPQINTSGKDEFPFLTDPNSNGRFLIFSSKGRFGEGGFDLYYTRFPSNFNEIGHFGSLINTPYDDFAMTIAAGADYGYFTSNRPGKGNDDIYKFTFNRILKPQEKLVQQPEANDDKRSPEKIRELYVFDKTSHRPIPGVRIVSCDKQMYLTDSKGKVATIPMYLNNCEVLASTFGYPEKSKVLLSLSTETRISRDTIWMDVITNQKIILHNIYYDFDRYEILPDASKELDQLVALMKQNPEMKVELSSHTDIRGSEIYNLRLSDLRAKSAVGYIVSKGIDVSRITGRGYGKSQLINNCMVPCTPAQHRENRRTELYIPGFVRGEAIAQTKGDYFYQEPVTKAKQSSTKLSEKIPEQKIIANVNNQSKPALNKFNFYIIFGSFSEKSNALSLVQQLTAEGYKANILNEAQPIRVGIGYKYFSQANTALADFRVKYNGAWILKNN